MSGPHDSRSILFTLAAATATGAGQAALHFCRALQARGWRVLVACGPPLAAEGDGSVRALREAGVEAYLLDRVVAPTWPVWRRLRAIARDTRPAAVVGVMQRDRPIAMALGRALGVPGVVAAQNQHVFWGPPPVRTAKRLLYAQALRRWASLVVCTSEPVRQEIIAFGVAEARTVVLPNGIPLREPVTLSPQDCQAVRAELGAGPGDLLLVNVGRLDVQKGQDVLIEAFAACAATRPRLRLALVGDVSGGPNRARMTAFAVELRRRAAECGLDDRIRFAGWRSDVARVLAAADGYVHAARWEGFSFAILEAMAAALPMVITDCSGTPDGFVQGRQGWVVPKGKPGELAEAVRRLADLPLDAARVMGRAARGLVERHYDIRIIGARFADLVADAVARGR